MPSARRPASAAPAHLSVTVRWNIVQHQSADAKSRAAPPSKPSGTDMPSQFAAAMALVKAGVRFVTKKSPATSATRPMTNVLGTFPFVIGSTHGKR